MKKTISFLIFSLSMPVVLLTAGSIVIAPVNAAAGECDLYLNHSAQGIFENFQSYEYVGGFLNVHFKLNSDPAGPIFNTIRLLRSSDCLKVNNYTPYPFPLALPSGVRNFSIRFYNFSGISTYSYRIYDDNTNFPLTCSGCNVTFSTPVFFGFGAPHKALFNLRVNDALNTSFVSMALDIQGQDSKTPVLIVPGILGSELYNGNDLIWANLGRMFSDINDKFLTENLSLDEQGGSVNSIQTGDIERKIFDVDIFKSLIQKLVDVGYQEDRDLFVFPYDWRLDLNRIKDKLEQKIESIKLQTGSQKVDIIAHSMGGLLTKAYLNTYGKNSVEKLIFVGTPHLGAPKAAKVLLEGDRFSIPWLEEDRMRDLALNSPSVYELLPNEKYFSEFMGYIKPYKFFGDQTYNYQETKDFLLNNKGKNGTIFENTKSFSQDLADIDLSGIDVYNIAGCKSSTQASYKYALGNTIIGMVGFVSGDETVPLPSADYVNIPSNRKFYLKNAVHAEMPSQEDVRLFISNVLRDEPIITMNDLKSDSNFCNFKGKSLTWHSPVAVHIYSQDKHTGPIENNGIEYGIPGVNYDIIGQEKFMFLPTDEGQEYQIKANGLEEGSFDLRISENNNGQLGITQVFNDVDITNQSKINLEVTNASVNESLRLDLNGTGNFGIVLASASLSGEEALDLTPPETTIFTTIFKDKKFWNKKRLQMTLNAIDSESGVLRTFYSLDEGETFNIYSEPVFIDGRKIDEVLYYSVDKAGNNEEIKELDIEKGKIGHCSNKKCLDIDKKRNKTKEVFKENE